ncbi:MAG: protein kinase [Myxococcales bacterium]|nr:protein kinase [Myxococcales bacterium]MCB9715682.1 protein kinase [Myxococcales bacterium]
MSVAANDLLGQVLDERYRIERKLGEGGMGFVFAGTHVTLGSKIAIKTLHPRLAFERKYRERFLLEAKAASKVRHPNVVKISDFGETPDGSVYFVMEYLEGRDLRDLLREEGPLPWPQVREILLQAVGALEAAHRKGIIHRDIKPANCFLEHTDAGGTVVKLLDFGIAKVGTEGEDGGISQLTGTDEVFGTATYMAPEQARGEPLDARSDVYALGIVAYEMLTGTPPFTGKNPIHVITKHLNEAPTPPRMVEPSIPPPVEALVLVAIAKDKEERFASMAAFGAALREIPEDAGLGSRKTLPWGESRSKPEAEPAPSPPRRASSAPPPLALPKGRATTEGRRDAKPPKTTVLEPTPSLEGLKTVIDAKAPPGRPPAASSPTLPPLEGPETVVDTKPPPGRHPASSPTLPPLEGAATVVDTKAPPPRRRPAALSSTSPPLEGPTTVVDTKSPPPGGPPAASSPTLPPLEGPATLVVDEPPSGPPLLRRKTIIAVEAPARPLATEQPATPRPMGARKTVIAGVGPSPARREVERAIRAPPDAEGVPARRTRGKTEPAATARDGRLASSEALELGGAAAAATPPNDAGASSLETPKQVTTDVSSPPRPSSETSSPGVTLPPDAEVSSPSVTLPPDAEVSSPSVTLPPDAEVSSPSVTLPPGSETSSPGVFVSGSSSTLPASETSTVGASDRHDGGDTSSHGSQTAATSGPGRGRLWLVLAAALVAAGLATAALLSRDDAPPERGPAPAAEEPTKGPLLPEIDEDAARSIEGAAASTSGPDPSTDAGPQAPATRVEDEPPPDLPPSSEPGSTTTDEDEDEDVEDEGGSPGKARPNHLTQGCAERRTKAERAYDEEDWKELVQQTGVASCWPRAEQARRRTLRVAGYLGTHNYKRCVAMAPHVSDAATKRMIQSCREQLEGQ